MRSGRNRSSEENEEDEDAQLKAGITTYGWGNWTAILRDRNYKSYTSHAAATLQRRAKQKRDLRLLVEHNY